MPIISDRRKNVSMGNCGKFGRNPSCVLALVAPTCKRLENRGRIAEESGETRRRPAKAPRSGGHPALCAPSFAENAGDTRPSCRAISPARHDPFIPIGCKYIRKYMRSRS